MSYSNNPYFDDPQFDVKSGFGLECHEKKCPRTPALLQSVSVLPQTVAAGAAIPFDTNLLIQGFGIIHTPGSTDFNLVQPGTYRATFTSTVTPVSTRAGVAIALNGQVLPGTTVNEIVVAGTSTSIATQALIRVAPFLNTILTVVNPTGGTETFTNPNIIIERIG